MRRRVLFALPALAVTGAAVAVGTGLLGGGDADPATAALTEPAATASVQRRTLTRTERTGGDLGYGDLFEVHARPVGGGMVTWLPAEGDVLRRGDTVYRVDQRRVPLLYGSIPLYRALSAGRAGSDVTQLERNLRALGYTGFTVDDEYTSATASAVRRWQKDLGRPRTGRVEIGDAVIASGARRVAALAVQPGAPGAGVLLTWTGTTRVVTIDLDVTYADLVHPGVTATVVLPDDTEVSATVTAVGAPTTAPGADGATLPVELAVPDQAKLGRYQAAEVNVDLAADTRRNVLAVPVNALVAMSGGGYAVTIGTDHLTVRTGMFSGGWVEISGPGVVEGLTVGVPG